jgi:2,4-dienoyl-CoA reductase-like NADH-dependent reductase (Old Yellow Enzyme family)
MKNRFMLAPLTNRQSHEDGTLSDEEYHWLTMRAKGQFGLVMTCASHVQETGKGFPGQLGIWSNKHIDGHKRLTTSIKQEGSLAVIQLHHAGMRSPKDIINQQPVCSSYNEETDARALSLAEVEQLREDFISAAVRAQKSGYDGVEIHGAHGYIIAQFLSAEINQRTDHYGGSLANRCRLMNEILVAVREQCGSDFLIGVRLSPEKFGMDLTEVKTICQNLINNGMIDFLDVSLWDSFKMPECDEIGDKNLLEHFTDIDRKDVKLTVAGKIKDGKDSNAILQSNVDFVTIGKSGILHHDFPKLVLENPNFTPTETPVSTAYLANEGLSPVFIDYMGKWPGFVEET